MARHGLTDEQWALIEDLFPEPAATGRPPRDPAARTAIGYLPAGAPAAVGSSP